MPHVSAFYGVVIYMYWNERDHPVVPVVVGVAVVGDRVLRLLFSDGTAGMSTFPVNGGRASFRR